MGIIEANKSVVTIQDDLANEEHPNGSLPQATPAETAIVKAERRATVAQPLLADLPTYVKTCTDMDGEVLGEYIERNWKLVTGTTLGLVYLVKEMKRKFSVLDRKKQVDGTYKKIRGFTSFDKWFTNLTGKSRRLAYYLLETEEKKNERNANRRAHASKSAPQDEKDGKIPPHWTDSEYIEACVLSVVSTLKPLESDPQRYARVAAAIAEKIVGENGNNHGSPIAESKSHLAAVA